MSFLGAISFTRYAHYILFTFASMSSTKMTDHEMVRSREARMMTTYITNIARGLKCR